MPAALIVSQASPLNKQFVGQCLKCGQHNYVNNIATSRQLDEAIDQFRLHQHNNQRCLGSDEYNSKITSISDGRIEAYVYAMFPLV